MKKFGMMLLLILSTVITCFSQDTLGKIVNDSTVLVTSEQLKYANLLFIEHRQLQEVDSLQKILIENYQSKVSYLQNINTLKDNQYKSLVERCDLQVKDLQSTIHKKDRLIKGLKIGSFTIGIGAILLLILK